VTPGVRVEQESAEGAEAAATRRSALLVSTLSSFLTPFMGSSVLIALPTIGREFGVDAIVLGWVATSFILAAAVFLLPFGRLADIHGRKRVYAGGVALFTGASLLCGLAPSVGLLIGFRALQGVGSTMMFGTGTAILTSVYPAGERGWVLGVNVAAVYLGLSLGPPLGGLLTQQFGWRSIFLVCVPAGLMVLGLIRWRLRGEWAGARGERFDGVGACLSGLGLVLLVSALSAASGAWSVGLIVLSALAFVAFVRWESRVPSPMLDMELFRRNPVFVFSNLAALIHYNATFGVSFLLSLYLQELRGLGPQAAGLVLLCQPALMAGCSPFAGRLSDRVEPRTVASTGMAMTATALAIFAFLGPETPFALVAANLVILGVGYSLFSSPNTNAVMGSVDRRAYGVASATLGTMRLTGNLLSMGTATLVLALFLGRQQITPMLHAIFLQGVRVIFAIFAGLCVGGVFASLARGKVR
jgi:EmrB/QacA subfamily drug resistance transporter